MPPSPQFRYVSTTLDNDGVALIKYNRPELANAINADVLKDMLDALQWATASPLVKVIIQTGAGRFFTTGHDLSNQAPIGVDPADGLEVLHGINQLLIECEKVTVAAVNGPGVGYGASSIALFDLVYAVPDAYFFTPFIKWGLTAEACSSFSLAHTMGRQKAAHLILTGQRMTAQELESAGLISKIIPKQDFLEDVLAIGRRLAALPVESLKINKQLIMGFFKPQLHQAAELERTALGAALRGEASQLAAKAFLKEQALRKAKL